MQRHRVDELIILGLSVLFVVLLNYYLNSKQLIGTLEESLEQEHARIELITHRLEVEFARVKEQETNISLLITDQLQQIKYRAISAPKQFLYLTQVRESYKEGYKIFSSNSSNFEFLSFGEINPNASLYLPNSTWTEGRNALYNLG